MRASFSRGAKAGATAFVFGVVSMLSALLITNTPTAGAADRCTYGFYQAGVHGGSNSVARLNPVQNTFSNVASVDLTAAGYNLGDDMIYGLDEAENLFRVNPATGATTQLNNAPLLNENGGGNTLSDEFVNSGIHNAFRLGDVGDGHLYVIAGGRDIDAVNTSEEVQRIKDVFAIDLQTLTYEHLPISYDEALFLSGDFVYFAGDLYSVDGIVRVREATKDTKLIKIDLDTQQGSVVRSWNNENLPRWSEYVSQWIAYDEVNSEHVMFVYNKENGHIYRLDDFNGSSPAVSLARDEVEKIEYGTDGASCIYTPIPGFLEAHDDVWGVDRGSTVRVPVWQNDYLSAPYQIEFCNQASDLRASNGSVAVEGERLVYTPDDGFTGNDHFSYTICAAGLTDVSTADVKIEVFRPDLRVILEDNVNQSVVDDNQTLVATVVNRGQGTARDVEVSISLPDNYAYVSDDSGGTYDEVTHTVNFPNIAVLLPDESRVYTVQYTVTGDGDGSGPEVVAEDDLDNVASSNDPDPAEDGSESDGGQVLGTSSDASANANGQSGGEVLAETDEDGNVLAETGAANVGFLISGGIVLIGASMVAYAAAAKAGYRHRALDRKRGV